MSLGESIEMHGVGHEPDLAGWNEQMAPTKSTEFSGGSRILTGMPEHYFNI